MGWTYEKCEREYAKRRVGNGYKRVAWCIQLEFDGKAYLFRHHNTITVRVHPGDKVQITPNGWRSKTTLERIEQFGGVHISTYQKDGLAESGYYVGNHKFEDGDWFDTFGRPLKHRRYKVRMIRKDAPRQWRKLREKFMSTTTEAGPLLARLLIGEFDPKDDGLWSRHGRAIKEALGAGDCLEAVRTVVDGDSQTDMSEAIGLLLRPRPQMVFGRVRRGQQDMEERDPLYRLNSALNAARRAFYEDVRAYYYAYPRNK